MEKKRFNKLHNYKLKINPNNIFYDYGLSNYMKINSPLKFYNKRTDRHFNNISSYNYTKTEEKKSEINSSTEYSLKMRINNVKWFFYLKISHLIKKRNLFKTIEVKNKKFGINDTFVEWDINDYFKNNSIFYFFKEYT